MAITAPMLMKDGTINFGCCPVELFLTGRKFFAPKANPVTDDFYCIYDKKGEHFFKGLGYYQSAFFKHRDYDSNIQNILENPTYRQTIIMVKNLLMKHFVQRWLQYNIDLYLETPKHKRHVLWEAGNNIFSVANDNPDLLQGMINDRTIELNAIMLPDM